MKQTMSLQCKGTKRGGPGTGVGVGEMKRNAQRNGISGPPEGSWWTKFHRDVLSPRACTGTPGSGATTWLLCSSWEDNCSDENLLLWVLSKLKLKMDQSRLKANLEAQILGIWVELGEKTTWTSQRALETMMWTWGWCGSWISWRKSHHWVRQGYATTSNDIASRCLVWCQGKMWGECLWNVLRKELVIEGKQHMVIGLGNVALVVVV